MIELIEWFYKNYPEVVKVIPEEVFDKMIQRFYPPLYDEFDKINYYF